MITMGDTSALETQSGEHAAFGEFTKACVELGLRNNVLAGVNDDVALLRFLRGKKFHVEQALEQFKEAHSIREAAGVLELYDNFKVEQFERIRRLYPHWTGRRDKRGLPICVFDIAALDSATMNAYKDSRAGRRDSATVDKPSVSTTIVDSIVFHDCITRFILPLCSIMDNAEGSGTEAMGCLYLVDVSALSLKQSWTLKDYTMDISKVLANNYPEMIDSILVIGAPRYFGAIWNVLKRWLDPRTASKIQILSSKDILSTLTSFIDLDNIPEKFGGHLAFEHGMTPNIDAATRQILESHGLPNEQLNLKGPFKWITGAGGESIPLAVGTDDGRTRLKAKATT